MWNVRNDVGELKAGVIYDGGPEILWALNALSADTPFVYSGYYNEEDVTGLMRDLGEVHAIMRENTSAKLFDLKQLLQETLDTAKGDPTKFEKVMRTIYSPLEDWQRLKEILGEEWKSLNANDIFGQRCPIIKHNGTFKVGIRPAGRDIVNTRDLGVMTPSGFFLCHKFRFNRCLEDRITKTVMLHNPTMRENVDVRVDFVVEEMERKGCYVEGGDCTIPSEDSVAVALNYHSTREAVQEVSRAFPHLRVYAVLMYPWEQSTSYAFHWAYHFDSAFVMIDDDGALVFPYVFDHPSPGRKFLMKAIEIIRKDLEEWHPIVRSYREAGKEIPSWWKERIYGDLMESKVALIEGVGRVEVYKGGQLIGRKESFIDALVDDDILDPDKIVYVGGDPEDYSNEFEYLFRAFKEGFFANCMIALRPRTLIAYEENPRTIEALKDHGCIVYGVKGAYMQKVGGMGTHCSIMPLLRT